MAEITAASVKALRDRTGLPMMECKKALAESGGDEAAAIELLNRKYKGKMEERSDREERTLRQSGDGDREGGGLAERAGADTRDDFGVEGGLGRDGE